MKANEFRIKNLIEYDNRIFEIDSIAEEFPTLNTIEFGIGVVDWNNINPIPLTEEWLLKFGFEKKSWLSEGIVIEVTYYQLANFIIYLLSDTFEVEIIRKGDNKQFNLFINFDKKVHILQNFYFALTGEELTIKN